MDGSRILYFNTQIAKNTSMLFSIKDTTTMLALNLMSSKAGIAFKMIPTSAPTQSRSGIITTGGSVSPILIATRAVRQPDTMNVPSPARLNLFTAYIKQKQSPVNVNGIARLITLPRRLMEENGPRMNCWIM